MSRTLKVEVVKVVGKCEVFKEGDSFLIEKGWLLVTEKAVCMHSLSSIMPYYVALSRGIEPKELGLAKKDGSEPNAAYVRCLDPCEITGGGSVTFRISVVED